MKIGQYLAKIWTRVQCATFFETRCIYKAPHFQHCWFAEHQLLLKLEHRITSKVATVRWIAVDSNKAA